jgi:nicotinamide-nucleotide amidase
MLPLDLTEAAARLLALYSARALKLATAESCTGGLVAGLLTEIAGSSDVVERGFVVYSNEAKTDLLSVPADLIRRHGAVSAGVAAAMAEGAIKHSRADVAVSITGIAGPGGGSAGKPVGLVYLAVQRRNGPGKVERAVFPGDRSAIRRASVERALAILTEAAG